MVFGSTRATLHHLKIQSRRIGVATTATTQAVYVAYLVYAIIFGVGTLWINATLLALTTSFLCLFAYTEIRLGKMSEKKRKEEKKRTRGIMCAYKWLKILFKGVNLATLLYGSWSDFAVSSAASTVVITLMTVLLVLEVLMTLGVMAVEYIVDTLCEAIEDDTSSITEKVSAPVESVKNGFRRFFGLPVNESEKRVRKDKFIRWEDELISAKEEEMRRREREEMNNK